MNKENTKLIARGISKKTIEDIVKIVKKNINLNENDLPIDPRIILDRLSTYYDDFEYIILQNNDPIFLYQEEGKLSVINGKGVIYFKSKTINSCNKGTYRSNFTIMHEIGHWFLNYKFGYTLSSVPDNYQVKEYENPEWQANYFAGEFLAPKAVCSNWSRKEIGEKCNVSKSCSVMRCIRFEKEKEDKNGK